MSIIFDLDGTLIDSSERMYRLFCELVAQCKFSKKEYWDLKRDKVNHRELLDRFFPDIDFDEFNSKWMSMIESEKYLLMDKNYEDTIDVLKKLYKKTDIYLLTARQYKQSLLNELEKLQIKKFFKQIFTTEGKFGKNELLNRAYNEYPLLNKKSNIFISDMGKDIQLGNNIGYKTVAITHGFMSGKRLQEYKPIIMIDELSQIFRYVDV